MNETQRRALRNGAVAAVLAALVGFSLDAAVSDREGPAATPTPAPSSTPICTAAWVVVPSADPDPLANQLLGVAAVAEEEVWAVGALGPADAPVGTLVERWDGERFEVVPSPNVGTVSNVLRAVDATAADDVWAVGATSSGAEDQPLILHWDGASWSPSSVPFVTGGASLLGVTAIAVDDVWAVGSVGDPAAGLEHALALHWDGELWTAVPLHIGSARSQLSSVSASSPDDVWAVGYRYRKPLVVRFDGVRWQRMTIDATGALSAVTALSGSDVWAVGSTIQWWNGQGWSAVGSVPSGGDLVAAAAVAADDVWAVGSRAAGPTTHALVQRFDGRRWSLVRGHGVSGPEALVAASASPSGAVWGVGYHDAPKGRSTLVVHRALACT